MKKQKIGIGSTLMMLLFNTQIALANSTTPVTNAWNWIRIELGMAILIVFGIAGVMMAMKRKTAELIGLLIFGAIAVIFVFMGQTIINFFEGIARIILGG